MDIYFCDCCATRVTGNDLKRGQGIKKLDVVVCNSCVESGEGADLLEKPAKVEERAQEKVAALAGAGAGTASAPSSGPLPDEFDDDHDEEFMPDEGTAELSSAASGFGALSPQEAAGRSAADDDLIDEAEEVEFDDDEYDDEGDTGSVGAHDSEIEVAAMADDLYDDDDDAGSDEPRQGQIETIEISAADVQKASTERKSGRHSARPSKSSKHSSKASKGKSSRGKAKTGASKRVSTCSNKTSSKSSTKSRRVRKQRTNGNMIMIGSGITLSVLIILLLVAIGSKSGGGVSSDPQVKSYGVELLNAVSQAKTNAVNAIRNRDLSALKSAQAQIHSVRDQVYTFESEAKRQGLTQSQIDESIRRSGFNALQKDSRTVRDLISELEMQR